MNEKVVKSLRDLVEAVAAARERGDCRIRVGDEVVTLVAPDEPDNREAERLLAHPVVAARLSEAAMSLEQGHGIPHDEVVRRLGQRKG